MYLEYFGLEQKPFEQVPDPSFLYLSRNHESALANIRFAVAIKDSFVVITGEIGSGKTTLLHTFLRENLSDAAVAYVTQTLLTNTELLESILVEFGQEPFGKSKVELMMMLKRFIERQHGEDRRVVIVIDEAQNLTANVLEELRLVTCVSPGKDKMINVVLVGQPQFNRLLDSPALVQLKQRCRFRYHLSALNEEETASYVEHRLKVAGGSFPAIFEPGMAARIYEHSKGIPRLINMLCDTSLIFAYTDDSRRVSESDLQQALAELGWLQSGSPLPAEVPETIAAEAGAAALVSGSGVVYPLSDSVCVIGRATDCTIRIGHSALSRYHAMIRYAGESWVLSDMKSTNGVYLNGRRVRSARLRHNDDVALGDLKLVFRLMSEVDAPTDVGMAGNATG